MKLSRTKLGVMAVATAAALGAMGLASPVMAASPDVLRAYGARVNFTALDDARPVSRFIVKYRDPKGPSLSVARVNPLTADLDRIQRASNGKLSLRYVRDLATGHKLVEASAQLNRADAEALMVEFAKNDEIEYVEPDAWMTIRLTPNDSSYNTQWHYFEATAGMNLPAAWDIATGTGARVAVLDTGITSHADLNANIVGGYDFISDSSTARDGNGRDSNPADEGDWFGTNECGVPYSSGSSWHGTHVAGTVAAVTNNNSGVAGVAYGAKVVPIRVLGKCGGSTSDIADAIVWAAGGSVSGVPANSNPAKVINMSLGGSGSCGSTFQNAINSAVGNGAVVVIAAGNSNANVSGFSPGNCNNVVSVAASDRQGNRAYYSNYGALIDVTAPGGETNSTTSHGVNSTLNSGSTTPGSASYAYYQGTSMAAPHVAGLAALMLSVDNTLTPAQIESTMKANVRALAGSCSGGCGAGLVDAAKTLQALDGGGDPPPPVGGTLTKGVPVTGLSASTGAELRYSLVVPSGASNLSFNLSGGTGDADMYVRFGSEPSTSSYDCRPYLNGNAETCSFAAPSAGTYYVMVRAYSSFSGVSLVGDYTTGGGGTQPSFFENTSNVNIPDRSTVESNIAVSGRTGNAPNNLQVAVRIIHTYRGDLRIDLVAPDGTAYRLKNSSSSDGADNVIATYSVNASSEVANGTWRLRVADVYNGDTGYIDSWSLQF